MYKVIFFLLMFSTISLAQVNISNISLKYGRFDNINFSTLKSYVNYYELGCGGKLFKEYLNWNILTGYWNDKNKKIYFTDTPTYAYQSSIYGFRFNILLNKLFNKFLPLDVYTGISHHIVRMEYIGGENYDYIPGFTYKDMTKHSNVGDIGLGCTVKLYKSFNLRFEAQEYFPLSDIKYGINYNDKYSIKLGLVYKVR